MSKQTFSTHGLEVKFEDNSGECLELLQNAVDRGLHNIGGKAVEYAQERLQQQGAVDTSNLIENIEYKVDGEDVYIGTNVEYGIYVEFGTGAENYPGGTPKKTWVYFDELDGEFHIAHPMRARPYLKPAATDHTKEYRDILKDSLENA